MASDSGGRRGVASIAARAGFWINLSKHGVSRSSIQRRLRETPCDSVLNIEFLDCRGGPRGSGALLPVEGRRIHARSSADSIVPTVARTKALPAFP